MSTIKPNEQRKHLENAKKSLNITWDKLAELLDTSKGSLNKYLAPVTSSNFRPIPDEILDKLANLTAQRKLAVHNHRTHIEHSNTRRASC